jgi:hypothetical protein
VQPKGGKGVFADLRPGTHGVPPGSGTAKDILKGRCSFDAAAPVSLDYATNGIGEFSSPTALLSIDLMLTIVSKQ